MKKCIVLANGRAPEEKVFEYLLLKGYDYLICADGGANSAKSIGLKPDVIIGDFDSVRPDVLEYFKDTSRIIMIKTKNDTDVEKALKFAVKKGFTEAVLLGGTGDRLDHSFCNLSIVLKFYDDIKINLISEQSILTAHKKIINLKTVKNEILSIYGFDKKTRITTHGLKFKLDKEALPFGIREGTSNVAKGKRVTIEIQGGKVFLMRNFTVMMENDLF